MKTKFKAIHLDANNRFDWVCSHNHTTPSAARKCAAKRMKETGEWQKWGRVTGPWSDYGFNKEMGSPSVGKHWNYYKHVKSAA